MTVWLAITAGVVVWAGLALLVGLFIHGASERRCHPSTRTNGDTE